jgi:hypothetical protein
VVAGGVVAAAVVDVADADRVVVPGGVVAAVDMDVVSTAGPGAGSYVVEYEASGSGSGSTEVEHTIIPAKQSANRHVIVIRDIAEAENLGSC